MSSAISVPKYVADFFGAPLRHPSQNFDAIDASIERVYKLISVALRTVDIADWEVCGRKYHSLHCNEPLGLERVDDKFYVYAEERGIRTPIAIFKNDHLAADYFVWLVSKGKVSIDWSLHLEMEP